MIDVAGVRVPRVAMLEVAHRLVLGGNSEAAGRVLSGLVAGDRITLDEYAREAVLGVLDDPPALLGQLREALTNARGQGVAVEADSGGLHRAAAERHESRAARHDEAAAFWVAHDDHELAEFERRDAELARGYAKLEHDRADYHERTRQRTNPRPSDEGVA